MSKDSHGTTGSLDAGIPVFGSQSEDMVHQGQHLQSGRRGMDAGSQITFSFVNNSLEHQPMGCSCLRSG